MWFGLADGLPHLMSDDELRGWLRNVAVSTPQLLDDDAVWRKFGPVFRVPGE